MKTLPLPPHVDAVLSALLAEGHGAVLVGGCVRDLLLGRAPNDYDVATAALPEQTAALFPRVALDGMKHGTVRVITEGGPVEVTTYRGEGAYPDNRHPAAVTFLPSLEEDLKRRDFTINAMALSREGVLTDPYHGADDLKQTVIRCVGNPEERFREDGLRLLRAVRFSAQLGFSIEQETLQALRACAHLAASLSAERVRDETEKILCSPRPALAGALIELGLLCARLDGSALPVPDFTPLGTLPDEEMLRWAGFCILLCRSGAVSDIPAFLSRLRLPGVVARACAGAGEVLKEGLPQDAAQWRLALSRRGVPACRCAAAMAEAAGLGPALPGLTAVLDGGRCYSLPCLAVRGGDLLPLGFSGRAVGQSLERLLLHVIFNPEDNRRETLLALARRPDFLNSVDYESFLANGASSGSKQTPSSKSAPISLV